MKNIVNLAKESVDNIIDKIENYPGLTNQDISGNDRKLLLNQLERSKKEFDANLFMLLAFGPVKSGKSTLIDLLAREEEVSPTKYGVEWTINPSIIKKTTGKSKITRYFSQKRLSDDDPDDAVEKKELFNRVFDYLRGTEDLPEGIEVDQKEYSQQTVIDFVTTESKLSLNKTLLITVIEIHAENSKILDEHTAIMDVPGLDGAESNFRKTKIPNWILSRADILLFVQSSISALPNDVKDFLKDVYNESKEAPILLIQNRINAKPWQDEGEKHEEWERQLNHGVDFILDTIGKGNRLNIDSFSANLGMAYDCMGIKDTNYCDKEDLVRKSEYLDLENKLVDMLKKRRATILENNSKKYLINTLKSISESFDSYKKSIEGFIEDRIKMRDKWREIERLHNRSRTKIDREKLVVIWSQYTDQIERNLTLDGFIMGLINQIKGDFKTRLAKIFNTTIILNYRIRPKEIKSKLAEAKIAFINDFSHPKSSVCKELYKDTNGLIEFYIKYKYKNSNDIDGLVNDFGAEKLIRDLSYYHIEKLDLAEVFTGVEDYFSLDKIKPIRRSPSEVIDQWKNKKNNLDKIKLKRDISYRAYKDILLNNLGTYFEKEFQDNIKGFFIDRINKALDLIDEDFIRINIRLMDEESNKTTTNRETIEWIRRCEAEIKTSINKFDV